MALTVVSNCLILRGALSVLSTLLEKSKFVKIPESVLDYHFSLLEQLYNVPKCLLLSCDEPSQEILTLKALKRPQLIYSIQAFIDPRYAYLVGFVGSNLERTLAIALNIPMYLGDPALKSLDAKANGKKIFREIGIPTAISTDLVFDVKDLINQVSAIYEQQPRISNFIVKLNHGELGLANYILSTENFDLNDLQNTIQQALHQDIQAPMQNFSFEKFNQLLNEQGAIVEELLPIDHPASCYGSISPNGELVEAIYYKCMMTGLCTFLGAESPLESPYNELAQNYIQKASQYFTNLGYIGSFHIDFAACNADGYERLYGLEFGLRCTGTTHFLKYLYYLTNATGIQDGQVIGGDGNRKYYIGANGYINPRFKGKTVEELIEFKRRDQRLQYRVESYTGVFLFHFLGAIGSGKLGILAIGNSREQALTNFNGAKEAIDSFEQSYQEFS